jgi:hypothetical protein
MGFMGWGAGGETSVPLGREEAVIRMAKLTGLRDWKMSRVLHHRGRRAIDSLMVLQAMYLGWRQREEEGEEDQQQQ